MPYFILNTNVKDVPDTLKSEITKIIARELAKPVSYIAVQINRGQDISFGGSDEPAALCDLGSIGGLTAERNITLSKRIMETLEKSMGMQSDRVYIMFQDLNKANVGYNKTTLAAF